MKQFLLLTLTFFASFSTYAQIYAEDSTVQVIGYWDMHETQTYVITNEKYRVSGTDTTQREFLKYEVYVTIKDSTANSYTIEWLYRDIEPDTDNPFARKLASISNNMKVLIKTDERGMFEEVVNWQDLRDEIKKSLHALRTEYNHIPGMDGVMDKVEAMFSTKEAIQTNAIKDVQQFYAYHGGRYVLGKEVSGQVPVTNNLGGRPFDSEVTILLDEINAEDNNSILRMWQTLDPEQLTNVTYEYLKKNASAAGKKFVKRKEFPTLHNETRSGARVHGSGWIIYSVETKEVTTDGAMAFEERIIEIKD